MRDTDPTHDPSLRSWVASANDPKTDFPIQNLPMGMARRRDGGVVPVVAIGDRVLDLLSATRAGVFDAEAAEVAAAASQGSLNTLIQHGSKARGRLRAALVELLQETNAAGAKRRDELTLPAADVEMLLPVRVGNYTDFYASIHHARNVGTMMRPDNPLLPNYRYVPIGYHGRASSIVVSGTPVRRPRGQIRDDPTAPPTYGSSRRLDYELEVGAYVGVSNALGEPVAMSAAEEHLWGLCLVNDWSARDIQSWEYQPLGPFLAKSFATSVSPWVVSLDALAPFRMHSAAREPGDPQPLPYLTDATNAARGAFDITLEVWLRTSAMRDNGMEPYRLSRSRFAELYWTLGQLVAHHTSNGCNLQVGDLLASGTVSGSAKDSRGCLLELSWRGSEPLELPGGERRAFLEDGDEVTLRGYAERDGFRRIGFGECRGVVSS